MQIIPWFLTLHRPKLLFKPTWNPTWKLRVVVLWVVEAKKFAINEIMLYGQQQAKFGAEINW